MKTHWDGEIVVVNCVTMAHTGKTKAMMVAGRRIIPLRCIFLLSTPAMLTMAHIRGQREMHTVEVVLEDWLEYIIIPQPVVKIQPTTQRLAGQYGCDNVYAILLESRIVQYIDMFIFSKRRRLNTLDVYGCATS